MKLFCRIFGHKWKMFYNTNSDGPWWRLGGVDFEYKTNCVICARCGLHLANYIEAVRPTRREDGKKTV